MRKPLSFSITSLIAFFAVVGIVLLFSFAGSWRGVPDLPEMPKSESEQGNIENPDYEKLNITKENVQSVVEAMQRPRGYYAETKSELYYDDSSATYLRRTWVRDNLSHLNIFNSAGAITMNVIYDDNFAYYWYPNGTRYMRLPRGEFSAQDEQMMMEYTDLLSLSQKEIRDARLTRFDGKQCIYAEAERGGVSERYWISAQTGLLLLGQILKEGKLVYSIQMIEIDLNVPDDSAFTLPDNVFVGNALK